MVTKRVNPCQVLFLILLCTFSIIRPVFSQTIHFEQIPNKLGLSQNFVSALHQDKAGFLWVGTKDGLNRFDGYEFKVYQHDPFDSTSISDNYVRAIHEDQHGRLWIGTSNGLNLFDRKKGVFYRLLPREEIKVDQSGILYNHSGLSHSNVSCILEDRNGHFWIGSRFGGLTKIEIPNDAQNFAAAKFTVFRADTTENSLWSNWTKIIVEDQQGMIWVHSLGKINTITNTADNTYQIKRLKWQDVNPQWKQHQASDFKYVEKQVTKVDFRFHNVFNGKNGIVWVQIAGGFAKWLPAKKKFEFYHLNVDLNDYVTQPLSGSGGAGLEDQYGRIWVTGTASLVVYDPKTKKIIARNHYAETPEIEIANIGHQAMIEDRVGNIWVGSSGYGLYRHSPQIEKFINRESNNQLRGYSIRSICETSDGSIWLSLPTLNLLKWNRHTNEINYVIVDKKRWPRIHDIGFDYIYVMREDKYGNLWLGGESGLFRFELKNGELQDWKHYKFERDDDSGKTSSVYDFLFDKSGKIWLITHNQFGVFDPNTGVFDYKRYPQTSFDNRLEFTYPRVIQQDNGMFWLGSSEGLTKYDSKSGQFTLYTNDPDNQNSLSHRKVKCILPDPSQPNEILWVGTGGGGLNRFNIKKEQFTHFKNKDGLPDNVVYGILSDEQGQLWLSTNRGIACFDPKTEKSRNYGPENGLQDNEFNTSAYFKNKKGELFFGGINGLNIFFPQDITSNKYQPNVRLTALKVANKLVDFKQENSRIQQDISETDHITLFWKDKVFSLEFSVLDLTAPQLTQYAYRMKGFNEEWQYIGNQRSATFTNLNPGQYTFQLKATNHDKIWNEEGLQVTLTILPPWWLSLWAYLIYVLTFCGIAYTIYRFQLNRQLDRAEAKRLMELDSLKNQLYTNITHEFRTPLTVILGMTEQIKGHEKEKDLILRNSSSLLRLINQVLDLAKLDSGNLKLHVKQRDIIPHLQYLTESFYSMATDKNIRLTFYPEVKKLIMDYDEEKMEHIVYNLLSNALKFTPEGGKVVFHANKEEDNSSKFLLLKVSDTGIGIGEEDQEQIFQRFVQAEGDHNHRTHGGGGTGIGLALTKELVELMSGSIRLESQLRQGSTFILKFPIKNQAPISATQQQGIRYHATFPRPSSNLVENNYTLNTLTQQSTIESSSPILLLVEDNADVAAYIKEILQDSHQIYWASDGQTGIEKALELIPDLIISDVMMPRKNGFELCETLKNDERTSHIPIILLTAKATEQDKIRGLKTGADAYLMKPFNKEELFVRLEKLLELRKALQEKHGWLSPVSQVVTSGFSPVSNENSIEEQFLQKLRGVIEAHLDEPEFDTQQLAQAVQLSQSQLYRKLKALMNQTPVSLIRQIRMQHAIRLLKESKLNISEVAYAVGYNDPNYFSRVFHKEFGKSPRAYRK